jgi:SAM-dependent methyltransferase
MLTDEQLAERIAQQNWTAHNIRLTPAVTTLPGQPDMFETDMRLHAILRMLRLLYHGQLEGRRVVDLGCLEGGFALALARQGCEVVGIEARAANIAKAQLVREHFNLRNLEFRLGDVKEVTSDRFGVFDVTLALGILYHLDDPVSWLIQLGEITRAVLIIESHFAPDADVDLAELEPSIANLGEVARLAVDGLEVEGRWFFEFDESVDKESQLWASYSNSSSFWLTKESLLRVLRRAGFDVVLEQHDYSVDVHSFLAKKFVRGLFVAVKSGHFCDRSGSPV